MLNNQQDLLESYSGTTVLVTGGHGFLGSALVDALSSVRCRIVLLVRPGTTTDFPQDVEAELVASHGDIQTPEAWSRALQGVDRVFHFAAQTSASIANQDPLADFHATIYAAVGIDPSKELFDGDRPVPITDAGKPIERLFSS